ncbi:ATP-binding cassette domain-containing protein, partial [Deinococcus radiopugnans]
MTAPVAARTSAADSRGMTQKGETLLEVRHLEKYFPIRGGLLSRVVGNVKAVNDISFKLGRGEVVGLVGESGSGKTTAGRAILRLIEPTGGEVIFNGTDVTKLSKSQMRDYRREMQIIFQDPFAS